MIINEYRFTKSHLEITIKLLKKHYLEGWQSLGLSVTYDNTILLVDDVFNNKGFIQLGYVDFKKAEEEIQTQDSKELTDYFYKKVINYSGITFRNEIQKQLSGLQEDNISYLVVNDKKVSTIEQAKDEYYPEKDLEVHYKGDVISYVKNNNLGDEYRLEDYKEKELMIVVRYRGDSVVIQGWIKGVLDLEETYQVDTKGKFSESLNNFYNKINNKNREVELEKIKIGGVLK